MTTLKTLTPFTPTTTSDVTDFVSSDTSALATHMNCCASTRSRFFGFQTAFESAHSAVSPRMVTAAVVAVILLGLVGIV